MTHVLVTGVSGTGKSSALAELGRRGYAVLDTDEPGWLEWVESSEEVFGGEWLWVEEPMTALLRSDDDRTRFVSGCARNQEKFYERFEAVVLLSAPADVILERIAHRTNEQLRQDHRGATTDPGARRDGRAPSPGRLHA